MLDRVTYVGGWCYDSVMR